MTSTASNAPSEAGQPSGSSFYAGMRVLPKAERQAMYAVYAFCRAVDDIADDQSRPPPQRRVALDGWRADLESLYAGRHPGQAAMVAEAVRRFDLRKADFMAVIDGMEMDVDEDIHAPSLATLDLYCDRVASAVGRLSVRIFGMADGPGLALAHHLGRALQLTNILRDIDEDAAIGRLYLAREHLLENGIDTTDPFAAIADPRIHGACLALARMAHEHYRQADHVLARRPKGLLLAPRLMQRIYSDLLTKMETVGWTPPRERVRIKKRGVIWTLARLALFR